MTVMSGFAQIGSNNRVSRSIVCRFFVLFLIASVRLYAQTAQFGGSQQLREEPSEITFCELSKKPATYNHKLVRLTAFVSFAFEDFSLSDPSCNRSKEDVSIWLTYGGRSESGAVYCCPGEGSKEKRRQDVSVEGITIPLIPDKNFTDLRNLLTSEHNTTVRASLVGRFFSGNVDQGQRKMPGYGHMGCCSLFVIQQVKSVDPHDRRDLDYSADAGWYESKGCKSTSLHYLLHVSPSDDDDDSPSAKIIARQRAADAGEASWQFSDPRRVALEALSSFYPGQTIELKITKESATRYVYRWKHGTKSTVAVVIRPYWLSFYASAKSVIWVATMLKEADCEHK